MVRQGFREFLNRGGGPPWLSFGRLVWKGLGFMGFEFWEFPKIRGTLFLGPYNKDPTI